MKCCDLTAAKLRHRVDVQRATETSDGQGGMVRAWSTVAANIAAFVDPVLSREQVRLDAIRSPIVARCFMRYRADLSASDVILFDGKRYNVRAVRDIENARRWLELELEAVAAI